MFYSQLQRLKAQQASQAARCFFLQFFPCPTLSPLKSTIFSSFAAVGATALQYATHLSTCSALLPGSDRQPCIQHWQMIPADHHSGLSQGVVIKGYGAYSISATTIVRLQPACNRSRLASVKFTIDVGRRNRRGRSSFHGLETVHRVTTTETSIRVEGIFFLCRGDRVKIIITPKSGSRVVVSNKSTVSQFNLIFLGSAVSQGTTAGSSLTRVCGA